MDQNLIDLVWFRAKSCCEYCHIPQQYDSLKFEIDHIIPEFHGGKTLGSNLCLACFSCNRKKGVNLSGFDPTTGRLTKLIHPRRHSWNRHFIWQGSFLVGKSAIGRTTIRVLAINDFLRTELRRELIVEKVFPPREFGKR